MDVSLKIEFLPASSASPSFAAFAEGIERMIVAGPLAAPAIPAPKKYGIPPLARTIALACALRRSV